MSHLVFVVDGGSRLQQSSHDLHMSFEGRFVQSCSLELDVVS